MSLLDDIKKDAKKAGGGLGKLFYVKDGDKRRVRFLTDFEEAIKIPWINCYAKNINCPNPEWYGKPNKYAGREGIKEDTMYLWQVYDYDANTVKPFLYKANNCSPILTLANMFETFKTITDRDFLIGCVGVGSDRSMPVVNMDKAKFRQKVVKLSMKELKKIVIEAHSRFQGDDDDVPAMDYPDMSPLELYNLCKERDIDAEKRQPKAYYVGLLERWDEENNTVSGYDDDSNGEDWGDEEKQIPDYENMKVRELYDLCIERGIKTEKRLDKDKYIDLLILQDEAKSEEPDEWGEDPAADDEWGSNGDEWENEPDEWDDPELELPFN